MAGIADPIVTQRTLDFSDTNVIGLSGAGFNPGSVPAIALAPGAASGNLGEYPYVAYTLPTDTDATAGLTRAITAMNAAGGGTLRLPPGNIIINGTLPSFTGVARIVGSGYGSSAVIQRLLTAPIFTFVGPGTGNVVLQDFKVSYLTQATVNGDALSFSQVSGVIILNVQTVNAYRSAVFTDCVAVQVTKFDITATAGQSDGVYITSTLGNANSVGFHFTDCTWYGPSVNGGMASGAALHIDNAQGIYVQNCDFLGFSYCLLVNPSGASQSVFNAFFTGTSFDLNQNGAIQIVPGANAKVYLLGFTNTWSSGSFNGDGVHIDGSALGVLCDSITFTGHRTLNCQRGIYALSTTRFELSNVLCVAHRDQTYGGMYFKNTDFSISGGFTGNIPSYPVGGYPTQQAYGLTIDTGCLGKIVGLRSTNNTTGNLNLLSTNNGAVGFHNCIGINPAGVQTLLQATGAASLVSGTVYTNISGFDLTLYIYGGTVSATNIGGSATSLVSGAFFLPANSTFSITFSVSPTLVFRGN